MRRHGITDIREFYLGLTQVGERKSYRDVKHYKRRKRWRNGVTQRFAAIAQPQPPAQPGAESLALDGGVGIGPVRTGLSRLGWFVHRLSEET